MAFPGGLKDSLFHFVILFHGIKTLHPTISPSGLPHNEVVPRLKERVMDFKQGMPVITSLRNPSLRQRHWDEIQRIIGKSISRDKNFTLGNLLEMNVSSWATGKKGQEGK